MQRHVAQSEGVDLFSLPTIQHLEIFASSILFLLTQSRGVLQIVRGGIASLRFNLPFVGFQVFVRTQSKSPVNIWGNVLLNISHMIYRFENQLLSASLRMKKSYCNLKHVKTIRNLLQDQEQRIEMACSR